MYYVYMLECADGTLYIGSTNDVQKRVAVHNEGKTGAKYTKPRRPVILKYSEEYKTKSDALKREWELKQLSRAQKLELIKNYSPSSPSVDM
jgi:putative endonuclease